MKHHFYHTNAVCTCNENICTAAIIYYHLEIYQTRIDEVGIQTKSVETRDIMVLQHSSEKIPTFTIIIILFNGKVGISNRAML